jgi:hypothetical protein
MRGSKRKCRPQELLLKLGQLVQMPEQRVQHIGKACERKFELALDPRRLDDGRCAGPLPRVLEQRRLADPRFAAQDQRAAVGGHRLIE